MTENSAPTRKPDSKSAWKSRARHPDITLPSGAVVTIQIPNLPKLAKAGDIPNTLLQAAFKLQTETQITKELIEESWDYATFIIPVMVIEPKLTPEDVPDLPTEDIEQLLGIAGRQTDVDAVGHHIAGLEANAAWRRFRGRLSFDEVAADVSGGG